VVQRGNRRQKVFFGKTDYAAYLQLMGEFCELHDVAIWSYCLMPSHVHLILVPSTEDSLARAVGEAHRRYTRRINFRKDWRGHLWQGRFSSFVMDEPYLMTAARYVQRNPVKAKLETRCEDWPWSSAKAHATGKPDDICETGWLSDRIGGWGCSWREYLAQPDEDRVIQTMRRHENTGRPLGDKPFVQRLEKLLDRRLLPGKAGRPPKKTKQGKRSRDT